MQIEIFALCDAATADAGKLNMLGAFDTIWVATVPTVHPQCTIALRVRFKTIERGEHRVLVNFVDMDGRHILLPANGTIRIDFPQEQRSGSANLILNIQGLKIERCGEYAINLAIDEREEVSLPLYVKQRTT